MNDTIPFPPEPSSSIAAVAGGDSRVPCRVGASERWRLLQDYLPADLSGHTALEIGCDGGFLSLELALRGADVTAIEPDGAILAQAREVVAAHGVAERVTLYQWLPYDIARLDQAYDIVLFPHMFSRERYPLLALDIAAQRVRRLFICDSPVIPGDELEFSPDDLPFHERGTLSRPGWPRLAFIENAFAGNRSTWWLPNRAAVEGMLRSAGFGIVARPADAVYLCQPRAGAREIHRAECDAATGLGTCDATQGAEPATTARHEELPGTPVQPAA